MAAIPSIHHGRQLTLVGMALANREVPPSLQFEDALDFGLSAADQGRTRGLGLCGKEEEFTTRMSAAG